MILVLKDSGGTEFLHKTMMTLEREHLDMKKCFLSALLEKGLGGGGGGEGGGGMPLPDFFGIFFQEVHFCPIKGVYFFQNAYVLNFELFFRLFIFIRLGESYKNGFFTVRLT